MRCPAVLRVTLPPRCYHRGEKHAYQHHSAGCNRQRDADPELVAAMTNETLRQLPNESWELRKAVCPPKKIPSSSSER